MASPDYERSNSSSDDSEEYFDAPEAEKDLKQISIVETRVDLDGEHEEHGMVLNNKPTGLPIHKEEMKELPSSLEKHDLEVIKSEQKIGDFNEECKGNSSIINSDASRIPIHNIEKEKPLSKDVNQGSESTILQSIFSGIKNTLGMRSGSEDKWKTSNIAQIMMFTEENNMHAVMSKDTNAFRRAIAAIKNDADKSNLLAILEHCATQMCAQDISFYIIATFWIGRTKCYEERVSKISGILISNQQEIDVSTISTFIGSAEFCIDKTNVLKLLHDGCLSLCKNVSYKPFCSVFKQITFIVIALKCKQYGANSNSAAMIWRDHLKEMTINEEAIDGLKKGLQFLSGLHLPEDYELPMEWILELFHRQQINFELLKKCAQVMLSHCPPQKHATLLHKLHKQQAERYLQNNRSELRKWCKGSGNVIAVAQCLDWMGYKNKILNSAQFSQKKEDLTFLNAILDLLDIEKCNNDIAPLLVRVFDRKEFPANTYALELTETIVEKMNHIHNLSTRHICWIYKNVETLPLEVIEHQLLDFASRDGAVIYENHLNELICLIVTRNAGAHNHSFLVHIINLFGEQYAKETRQNDFLNHLLKLNIPGLFDGSTLVEDQLIQCNLVDQLTTFLTRNYDCNYLFKNAMAIIDRIDDRRTFHRCVGQALVQVITPHSDHVKMLCDEEAASTVMMVQIVNSLCSDKTWMYKATYKQCWCWAIISSCCAKLPIGEGILTWINNFKAIEILVKIYDSCIKSHEMKESDAVIKVAQNYMMWIQNIQQSVKLLGMKVCNSDCNWSELDQLCQASEKLQVLCDVLKMNVPFFDKDKANTMKLQFNSIMKKIDDGLVLDLNGKVYTLQQLLKKYSVTVPDNLTDGLIMCNASTMAEMKKIERPIIKWGNLTLRDLETLLRNIDEFLKPIVSYMPTLCHFYLHPSQIFEHYLQCYIKQKKIVQKSCVFEDEDMAHAANNISTAVFGQVLDQTECQLINILTGKVPYSEIVAIEGIEMNGTESQSLSQFAILKGCRSEGLQSIESMLQLFNLPPHIDAIIKVCKQYELTGCTNDSDLEKLTALSQTLKDTETKSHLTPNDAAQQWKCAMSILCCENMQTLKNITKLLECISNSVPFYNFVKDMTQGANGSDLFQQKYELITAQLQHEEYNESVLNHLYSAYRIMLPFLDAGQRLHSLMEKLTILHVSEGVQQLETVNENITVINLWFSRADSEGDTDGNTTKLLNCIMHSGNFVYRFMQTSEEVATIQMMLEYQSQDHQKWPKEKIDDFVKRLGFLDTKSENQQSIKGFIQLNMAACKLLSLFEDLQRLGHIKALPLSPEVTVLCNKDILENEVEETNRELLLWRNKVATYYNKNSWILFFSTPKILRIHAALQHHSVSSSLVKEISLILNNDGNTFYSMCKKDEDIREEFMRTSSWSDVPVSCVSTFLDYLLTSYHLPSCATEISGSCFTLHKDCLRENLFETIIVILGGVPKPFQLFHCQNTSSKDELFNFLTKVTKFTFDAVIADVGELCHETQEFLMEKSEKFKCTTRIHCVEVKRSILREANWFDFKECKNDGENRKMCKSLLLRANLPMVHIVYGNAGNGKTYYISERLKECPSHAVITINEGFKVVNAIRKLCELPFEKEGCAIYFNILAKFYRSEDQKKDQLLKVMNCFLFDLLVLGYVEDINSGLSFKMPQWLKWIIYIEVPCQNLQDTPSNTIRHFYNEIPMLELIGVPHEVQSEMMFAIAAEEQLVAKYLKAFHEKKISTLYDEENDAPVKFGDEPDMPPDLCINYLQKQMPQSIKSHKVLQKLYIKYMYNRCRFLDNLPTFNYNEGAGECIESENQVTDTRELGSTLMQCMLNEVEGYCNPSQQRQWSSNAHEQVIYDFKDGGGSIGFVTSQPESLAPNLKTRLQKLGVNIPSRMNMHSRQLLDSYLSRGLGVQLENDRLKPIDDASYVLTMDYTIKMLSIHERFKCGIPVIIQGETGVGKTALLKMLSDLWNHSYTWEWKITRERLGKFLRDCGEEVPTESEEFHKKYEECADCIENPGDISVDFLQLLPDVILPSGNFYSNLRMYLLEMKKLPIIAMLEGKAGISLHDALNSLEHTRSNKGTAEVLSVLHSATIKSTFYRILIHSALTAEDIVGQLQPIFLHAKCLSKAFPQDGPYITLFLDEINTSSCCGLLKELIIDQALDGMPIPKNLFIVAACNPYRGNSLASHSNDRWLRGSYYVHELFPTMQLLMWDYGSLSTEEERHYIKAKMDMLHLELDNVEVERLTDLIITSQGLMRKYAKEQLLSSMSIVNADMCSQSCVSQRDIQRVFTVYGWLLKAYSSFRQEKGKDHHHRRAVYVALALVYYMRLNKKYRDQYKQELDKKGNFRDIIFSTAFKDELDFYASKMQIPIGIAKTNALMENIYATIVCAVTRTPLIIVGAPGSSKTLSFNLVVANLKGKESKVEIFRNYELFPSLDPYYYQCSRRTTSNEVQTVFTRAINRQQSHKRSGLLVNCVVFMDEAGLPEESHESLKVLHYYLDTPNVSFVAISNHVLDAAKTNRAISLFRHESPKDDLFILAQGCYGGVQSQNKVIDKFCTRFLKLLEQSRIQHFFGLRDFIHFINYLRLHGNNLKCEPQIVMQALERNFNGSESSIEIWTDFLSAVNTNLNEVQQRHTLDVFSDSLTDRPKGGYNTETEVRFKLLIDPSEDDSLVRLLFLSGILERTRTRMFMCSDLSDSNIHKINTIAGIIYSASVGHTIVMAQTDEIHECFYDLFNQHFRRIDDPTLGTRYYANIAIEAHSKPCRVHPDFQCIVVIKKSEVMNTPAPFLNRFEKFNITHSSLLESNLKSMSPCIAIIMRAVREKVEEFINSLIKAEYLYGFQNETADSLLLSVLPSHNFKHQPYIPDAYRCEEAETFEIISLQHLLYAITSSFGYHISETSFDELDKDCKQIVEIISNDPSFDSMIQNSNTKMKKGSYQDVEHKVVEAINEALNTLHNAPASCTGPNTMIMSQMACFMVSLMVQWLTRYLQKRIIQLMHPAALTLHMETVSTYSDSYLHHQFHFSLKSLISKYIDQLQSSKSRKGELSTKVLCYTQSSQLLHKLPASFTATRDEKDDYVSIVGEFVHNNTNNVMMFKLSSKFSQADIEEIVYNFIVHEHAAVLLLIANMTYTTKKSINHIRIMIEEIENKYQSHNKLFILMLQFSSKFSNPCYPTLFLNGWDHIFLDSIAPVQGTGCVNIYEWLLQSSLSEDNVNTTFKDSLLISLNELLPSCVSIVSSSLQCSPSNDALLNSKLPPLQRNKLLKELLLENEVGKVLCEKFINCCTASYVRVMINEAAQWCKSQDSKITLSDALQVLFRKTFIDYLIVMCGLMNENCNMDTFFRNSSSSDVKYLFTALTSVLSSPNLVDIQTRKIAQQAPQVPNHNPSFPYFFIVVKQMDELVDNTRKELNEQSSIPFTSSETLTKKKGLTEAAVSRFRQIQKGVEWQCLNPSMEAIEKYPTLWMKYFNDVLAYKLHLSSCNEQQAEILKMFFQQDPSASAVQKMVNIHCYLCLYRPQLGSIATILRPLSVLKQVSHQSIIPDPNNSNPATLIVMKFVITTLFESLSLSASSNEGIEKWFCSYKNISSLPRIIECIQEGLGLCPQEPRQSFVKKFIIMQAVFAVMKASYGAKCKSIGVDFPNALESKYSIFLDKACLKHVRLPEIIQTISSLNVQDAVIGKIMDELFNHFFGTHMCNKHIYDRIDCEYFMELANNQYEWLPHSTLQELNHQRSEQQIALKLPINLCKFYLSRILLTFSDEKAEPFGLFNIESRLIVAKVLLSAPNLPHPSVFIPVFYYQTPGIKLDAEQMNSRMLQPLAYLYFLTILEKLQEKLKANTVFDILSLYNKTKNALESAGGDEQEMCVLYIELQAIIQLFIQHLSLCIRPDEPKMADELSGILCEINTIMDDNSSGGGRCHGHSLVLVMHLFQQLGEQNFLNLIQEKYQTIYKGVQCLEWVENELKGYAFKIKGHQYMLALFESGDSKMYESIKHVLSDEDFKIQDLITAADLCTQDANFKFPIGRFRMLVWLVVYFEFYVQNKTSTAISDAFAEKEVSKLFENGQVKMIRCFLDPNLMVNESEETNTVLDLNATDDPITAQPDPLNAFFKKIPEDLHHSLALVVALVMRCPPESNHYWFHLFNPEALLKTYLPGYAFDLAIQDDNPFFYDCGVQLLMDMKTFTINESEQFCYTDHSRFVLLWSSFGALNMGLLTQPENYSQLHGKVISEWLPLRNYCLSKLHELWILMQNKEGFDGEERIFLIAHCTKRLCEFYLDSGYNQTLGIYKTSEEVQTFENVWHTEVYEPSLKCAKDDLHHLSSQNCVLHSIRSIGQYYPIFYDIKRITFVLKETVLLHSDQYHILKSFLQNYDKLQCGGQLLVHALHFYQWVHTNLAYCITQEEASEYSLEDIMAHIKEWMPIKVVDDFQKLCEALLDNYNKYVDLLQNAIGAGACSMRHAENKFEKIHKDVKICYFLSDTETVGDGNDWLYIVMSDIVIRHNAFIQSIYHIAEEEGFDSIRCHLPSEPLMVPLSEYTEYHSIIPCTVARSLQSQTFQTTDFDLPVSDKTRHENECTRSVDDFIQLFRRRCLIGDTEKPDTSSCICDLASLQEDVIRYYCIGRPLLEDPQSIRTPFKFKVVNYMLHNKPTSFLCSKEDLEALASSIPETMKCTLDEKLQNEFKNHFHSANFSIIASAIEMLKNALGYMKMDCATYSKQTLHQFMKATEIGQSQGSGVLSEMQLKFLKNLPTTLVFFLLKKFIEWVDDGMHNYHSFPLSFKHQLSPHDLEVIQGIPEKWKGPMEELSEEIDSMLNTLDHIENHISPTNPETPLMQYLKDNMLCDTEHLAHLIPDTVLIKNFFAVKIALRRLQECTTKGTTRKKIPYKHVPVADIWAKWLPHLRDKTLHTSPSDLLMSKVENETNTDESQYAEIKQPSTSPETAKSSATSSMDVVQQLTDTVTALQITHNKESHLPTNDIIVTNPIDECSDSPLDEDDISDILNEIQCTNFDWKRLGLALRLKKSDLDAIVAKNNASDIAVEVLSLWLKGEYNVKKFGPPSWKVMCKAIMASGGGNDPELAKKIAMKHPNVKR